MVAVNKISYEFMWNKKELVEGLGVSIDQDIPYIKGVSIDSKSIKQGEMFLALRGDKFDGHDFIEEALSNGAALCVVHNKYLVTEENKDKLILVSNTYQALLNLAKFRRSSFAGSVIAITGSVGKTNTKEMLKLALSSYGKVYASLGNKNNHIGVPLSIINMPSDGDFIILELGMSGFKEIEFLSKLVTPDIGIITNIYPVHIENFASIADIAKAKAEIFAGIKKGGCVLYNSSQSFNHIFEKYESSFGVQSVGFGYRGSECYFSALPHKIKDGIKELQILCKGKALSQECSFELSDALASNILPVLLCIKVLGLDINKARSALSTFVPFSGRGNVLKLKNDIVVIDQSYNSSPVALDDALRHIVSMYPNDRKIAILGDMKELGEKGVEYHKIIDVRGIDKIFCVGELMQHLYNSLPEEKMGGCSVNALKIKDRVLESIQEGDKILVKGSNSMNLKICIVDYIKRYYEK